MAPQQSVFSPHALISTSPISLCIIHLLSSLIVNSLDLPTSIRFPYWLYLWESSRKLPVTDGSWLKTHEFCLTMAMETAIDKQSGHFMNIQLTKGNSSPNYIAHHPTVAGCIMHGPLSSSSFSLIPDTLQTSLNILRGQMGQPLSVKCSSLFTHWQNNLHTFFSHKWQRPSENVHEIWKPVWMRRTIKLSDIHNIVFIFQYCSCKRKRKKNHFSHLIIFLIWSNYRKV